MKRFSNPILVTRPYLPPLAEFQAGCEEIWRNQWLTNNGPMLQRFASELAAYLGRSEKVGQESRSTKEGSISPLHAGTARDRGSDFQVASEKDQSVHCPPPPHFSTSTSASASTSIAACGDMSMFSFHPTKLFHSCEGGCLVFKDASLQEKLFQLRNFAIKSETECVDVGSNAKMNELQALMGLCCLRKMPDLLAKRQAIYDTYAEVFNNSTLYPSSFFPEPRLHPRPL